MTEVARRITLALVPRAAEALDATAKRAGLSKTDVLNRAVQMYDFIDREIANGASLLVKRGDETKEVRFL